MLFLGWRQPQANYIYEKFNFGRNL